MPVLWKKGLRAAAALMTLGAGALSAQTAVRKAAWGMTQAQVMASEGANPPASARSAAKRRSVMIPCSLADFAAHFKPNRRVIWREIAPFHRKSFLPTSSGLEIAFGHLKLYTQWTAQGTTILHALTSENHRITHQIEWRPAAARADHR